MQTDLEGVRQLIGPLMQMMMIMMMMTVLQQLIWRVQVQVMGLPVKVTLKVITNILRDVGVVWT